MACEASQAADEPAACFHAAGEPAACPEVVLGGMPGRQGACEASVPALVITASDLHGCLLMSMFFFCLTTSALLLTLEDCCLPFYSHSAGVYTDVAALVPWITEAMACLLDPTKCTGRSEHLGLGLGSACLLPS